MRIIFLESNRLKKLGQTTIEIPSLNLLSQPWCPSIALRHPTPPLLPFRKALTSCCAQLRSYVEWKKKLFVPPLPMQIKISFLSFGWGMILSLCSFGWDMIQRIQWSVAMLFVNPKPYTFYRLATDISFVPGGTFPTSINFREKERKSNGLLDHWRVQYFNHFTKKHQKAYFLCFFGENALIYCF